MDDTAAWKNDDIDKVQNTDWKTGHHRLAGEMDMASKDLLKPASS